MKNGFSLPVISEIANDAQTAYSCDRLMKGAMALEPLGVQFQEVDSIVLLRYTVNILLFCINNADFH